MVSTDCFNKTLAPGLVPFDVRQKNEMRETRREASFVEYLEITIHGNEYNLLKKLPGNRHVFEINGLERPTPYFDREHGVNVYTLNRNIIFSTEFGLTVTWDGHQRAAITLCDAYANSVCGMCGNADGKLIN